MTTLSLGQVRPRYREDWEEKVSDYRGFDWVLFQGCAWVALKDVPAGYQPDSQPEYWALFGAKGADGQNGAPGEPGAPGRDGVNGIPGGQGPPGPSTPLSDAVNRTDSNVAASSKAVKAAYDRGTAGVNAANTAQVVANTAKTTADTAQATATTANGTAKAAQQKADTAQQRADAALNPSRADKAASYTSAGTDSATGFKLANGSDIAALFGKLNDVENATSGSGTFVTGVNLSVNGNNIKITQSKGTPGYCGYCSHCAHCTYCTYCNCDCQC